MATRRREVGKGVHSGQLILPSTVGVARGEDGCRMSSEILGRLVVRAGPADRSYKRMPQCMKISLAAVVVDVAEEVGILAFGSFFGIRDLGDPLLARER